jgi:cyclopropane fatty-acyl-phospholipid synthase-like methyltransferase
MDHQLETINVYNQYVKEYVIKFMNFELYNDTFDDFLNLLKRNSTLLELGCGPGNVVKYFTAKRNDLKITGIDLAPEMLIQARILNPNAVFQLMDIREIQKINEKFEAVVGAFCLPYLSYNNDLELFFINLSNLTKPDGLIYISCMEGEIERSGLEKTSFTGDCRIYIYYHQRNNLEALLSKNGFVIEKFYTKDYPESDGSFTRDLIYIGRKINVE